MPKTSAKADAILSELHRQIAIGNFARGSALPSQYELAKNYHVSHMTVRKAIAALTKDGILRCVPRVGFFVNDIVSERKLQRQVGVIIPAYATPEFIDFVIHMTRICEEKHLLLRQTIARHWDDRAIDDCIETCDGIVAWQPESLTSAPPMVREKLHNCGKPFVFIGGSGAGLGFHTVSGDSRAETDRMIDELKKLGHRRIGICAQKYANGEYINFYHPWLRQMTQEMGSEAAAKELLLSVNVPEYEDTEQELIRLLREKKGRYPFSVLLVTAAGYLAAVAALAQDGLSVPRDLSLAVIGDRRELEYYQPRPTQLKVSLKEHAQQAVELLLKCWEEPGLPPQDIRIYPQFIPGASVRQVKSNEEI
ncbi:MAG: substrate-binding domain-containing protein [Victivallaceae bacterium]|nr:substrate-binding domain-containing protein [Victivallaceae bacterium]